MQNDRLKNYLHLHLLVFIAGFTAILGELITISAIPLVWFRMLMASILIVVYIKVSKVDINIRPKAVIKLFVAGIIIALHWITFFGAIDVSNVSIALAMFSTGAFFASIIEPIVFKRKVIWYEIIFGILVVVGIFIVTQSEIKYLNGIVLGITSAFLSSLFAVLNGKFLQRHSATVISFYEFISGVAFITLFILLFNGGFSFQFFKLSLSDYSYLFILASVCTAYAFIAAVHVMKVLSPFTVILSYNLEPVYGIIIAIILFPEKEKMSPNFYYGAFIIIATVMLNGLLKNKRLLKRKRS
ncbi:MAG: DMT family transporter [Flavobacteriales bacterium]|nr:DMT family transporter [Flavobacteriia bacterium]NCP05763.1 DMT family transporter [Flavobacteriales bacterium]PIV93604.1 MAG: EamA family transporter [Flavobacteriaceae bacterium CG17_big_fil_post_rev_8_21_14_2_50_33_15]PIY13050.1 MAG: EamA family transporter [Flavobacteriaceae bacterium CG_4_10_14_3_um_filter_33_47]PJB16711.1 MAG: EamA family transporter [Flavobacteriaceae bacterium CG_4_9_14_3_um_filter_33_16]